MMGSGANATAADIDADLTMVWQGLSQGSNHLWFGCCHCQSDFANVLTVFGHNWDDLIGFQPQVCCSIRDHTLYVFALFS